DYYDNSLGKIEDSLFRVSRLAGETEIRGLHSEDKDDIHYADPCIEIGNNPIFFGTENVRVQTNEKEVEESWQDAAESVQNRFACKSLDLTHYGRKNWV